MSLVAPQPDRSSRPRRSTAAILLALALLALTGCGRAAELPQRAASPEAPPVDDPAPALVVPEAAAAPAPRVRSPAEVRTARRAAAAARRRAELARLMRSGTVAATLRRGFLRHALSRADYDRFRAGDGAARAALGRLGGARRLELAAVLANLETLARDRALTVARMPATFLTLARNVRAWTREPLPAPRERRRDPGDPVVFEYYRGQGLQLQPLASWGRVDGVARFCLQRPGRCPRARLAREADRLVALGVRRDGFLAWEYGFRFGGGRPPWVSGITQATAVQALVRAGRALGLRRLSRAGRDALGAFDRPPPEGVAVGTRDGLRLTMYSFDPGLRVLNGELQAVSALRDAAIMAGDAHVRALYRRADSAARAALPGFDTGAWSLYSAGGAEATLGYHELTTEILGRLCDVTHSGTYCGTQERFARYLHEGPGVSIAVGPRPRPRRWLGLRVAVSKGASVDLVVWGPRGAVLRRGGIWARGTHRLAFMPTRPGRYVVRVAARGPEGRRSTLSRALLVPAPRRPVTRRPPAAKPAPPVPAPAPAAPPMTPAEPAPVAPAPAT